MSKRKGKITKIGKSKYSFFVLLDGDNFYFNTKFDPKAGVGDVVGITYDQKAENRGQVKDIKLLEDNGGPKGFQDDGGSSGGGSSNGGGTSYSGGGNDNRQASIIYQSSRKDAIEVVRLLVDNDLVKLPKGDKGRIVVDELIAEYIAQYVKDATDPASAVKAANEVADDANEEPSSEESSNDDWDDDDWS